MALASFHVHTCIICLLIFFVCVRVAENNNKVLNITTKKVFRLRNTGQVSVHIYGFTINGLPCQGYGFKITNCHNAPFVLKPGMSKRVSCSFFIIFTYFTFRQRNIVKPIIRKVCLYANGCG